MAKRRAGTPPVQADWEGILPTKVFISYTQESTSHNKRVLSLANELRDVGFDCDLDQYHVNENWPVWMERSIEQAKYVLVVCTPVYRRRWDNQERPGVGLGAQWESLLTRQHLYVSPNKNDKFIPVVFKREHASTIPTALAGWTRIDLWRKSGLKSLRCRLLNIPPAVILLLVGTHPVVTGLVVDRLLNGVVPVSVAVRVGCWLLEWCVGTVHAIAGGIGQKADVFDFVVHALLEQGVQTRAFGPDLGQVGEFGADTDDVGMTAAIGQPQLLAVDRFEDDCHVVAPFCG